MNYRKLFGVLGTAAALLFPLTFASDASAESRPPGSHDVPAPWKSVDVGAVGVAGDAWQGFDGDLFVNGAGSDIWGSADSFHFVYQSMLDGSITTIAPRPENTHQYAKAGIMIRQSLDPSSPSVILDIKPDGSVEFMVRQTAGGPTRFLAGFAGPVHYGELRLARSGRSVSATICVNGEPCKPLGSTLFWNGPALTGAAVTSHDPSVLNHAYFPANMPVVETTASPIPRAWTSVDVGAVGQAGSAAFQNPTFTVKGAGSDIWGTADSFHYVYLPMNGEGEIQATVRSLENTGPYAKAGLMVRQSLDPDSATVILDVKPDGGIEFMARTSSGAEMNFISGGFVVSFPIRLRLTRVAAQTSSLFIAFVQDPNSGSWAQVGFTQIDVTPKALVGLAVTSQNPDTLTTGVFDVVSVIRNLLDRGSFEEYTPPELGPPGWISDQPRRPVPAKSETTQPHGGFKNGACWATTAEDCGIFQDVIAPADGTYVYRVFANADRQGGLIGVDVTQMNGTPGEHSSRPVPVRGFGNYGVDPLAVGFFAHEGDTIHVWMYSPAIPGYVVIDDATLVQDFGPH